MDYLILGGLLGLLAMNLVAIVWTINKLTNIAEEE